uniref:EGF-like domain-containing protein n=1 Tax=Astatotilapia calliptera TaxID=8154 RepID=A0A3P8PEI8_ASTCA
MSLLTPRVKKESLVLGQLHLSDNKCTAIIQYTKSEYVEISLLIITSQQNPRVMTLTPFLIFGHGKAIHRMGLNGKNHRRLVPGVGSSILLDFHFKEQRVYWVDRHTGKLYSYDKHISGLAVDWIWNSVYWTSGEKGEVKRIDINGKKQRTLLRHLTQPNSISVDPSNRFLFWLSGGMSPSIQRSDVTGQMKITLIKITEQLRALSIDRVDKRLFWVQFGPQGESAIASCDYNGNALHTMNLPLQSHSVGISVFLEHIYYTDSESRVIKQVNKYTGGEPHVVNIKQMGKPPVDIKIVHPLNQPTADPLSPFPGYSVCQCSEGFVLSMEGTYCKDVNECAHWNHGCSLGCENIPGSYFCTCPKGYALLPDRKTCQEIIPCERNMTKCGNGCLSTGNGAVCVCPEGSILQEDGQTCTGCSSADRGGCSQLCNPVTPVSWECGCLPGYQLHQDGKHCIATGPPSYLLVANLVDVRRINPDGTVDQILAEEPRGIIVALDYDPVQNNVYFASTSQKTIERVDIKGGPRNILISDGLDSPEGLAVDWVHRKMYWTDKRRSTVDCSTLDGLHRETIVRKGLEKPRGIAVHPLAKKLFWTDIGTHPVVECSSLEGRDRAVIARTNLVSPTGLTIDFTEDRVFWCDQRKGTIETAALDGSDRRVLSKNQVGQPFDLALFEDRLWISDQERHQLTSVHKRTGKTLQWIQGSMVQPASIVVVHPLAKPGADMCLHLKGGCSQVCESKMGFAHCSCFSHYILSADGKTCLTVDASNGTAGDVSCVLFYTVLQLTAPIFVLDIDECNLGIYNCDKNEECQNTAGKYYCKCLAGYYSDGQTCQGDRFLLLTYPGPYWHILISCPATYETYCLYHGVCFYFPELDSYACNCVSGYMGERCQFSDLEWLELQRAEKEKKRNVVITACMVVLVSLLSITACVTYCYG